MTPNDARAGAFLRLRAGADGAPLHVAALPRGTAPDAPCLARGVEGRVAAVRGPATDTLRLDRFVVDPLASHRAGCGSLTGATTSVWVVRPPEARLAASRVDGRRTTILLGSVVAVVGVAAYSVSQMQFDLGSGRSGRGGCMSIC